MNENQIRVRDASDSIKYFVSKLWHEGHMKFTHVNFGPTTTPTLADALDHAVYNRGTNMVWLQGRAWLVPPAVDTGGLIPIKDAGWREKEAARKIGDSALMAGCDVGVDDFMKVAMYDASADEVVFYGHRWEVGTP